MKKLSLKKLNLQINDLLQKEDLKQISGGYTLPGCPAGCPPGTFRCTCNGIFVGCYSSASACQVRCDF